MLPAHVRIRENHPESYAHKPLQPRPARLNTSWHTFGGVRVTLRPMRPQDAALEQAFVKALSAKSRYLRFMGSMRELTPQMLKRFTQIDHDREMAYVATIREDGNEIQIGVCRYVAVPGSANCEFALAIADSWQRRGLGLHMMLLLMRYARTSGMHTMFGEILASNDGMLGLCAALGFQIETSADNPQSRRAIVALPKLDT